MEHDLSSAASVPDLSDTLLERYLADECSSQELAAVQVWIGASPESAERLAALRVVAGQVRANLEVSAFPDARAEFLRRVQHGAADATPSRTGTITSAAAHRGTRAGVVSGTRTRLRGLIAAGVLAAACVLVGVWGDVNWSRSTDTSASAATREYRTVAGQRAKIDLADGSSVVLGVQSTLRLDPGFGVTTRTVHLDGEALFTIANNRGVPFAVQAGSSSVRVLGTTFTVRHYTDEPAVRVVVASGKVAMRERVLSTGDLGVATDTEMSVTHDVNVATELAWADGKLVLERMTLRDAIPELRRWYGIEVEVRDPELLSRRISTTLTTESAADAIQLFAAALKARGTLSGHRAVFTL